MIHANDVHAHVAYTFCLLHRRCFMYPCLIGCATYFVSTMVSLLLLSLNYHNS